jgi:hypothetical protein
MSYLDQAATLLGQPASYWSGQYHRVDEVSPIFRPLLQHHPITFLTGAFVWTMAFCLLIVVLPRRPAMVVALAFLLGHTWGTASWILAMPQGYWLNFGLFLGGSAIAVFSWERFYHATKRAEMANAR